MVQYQPSRKTVSNKMDRFHEKLRNSVCCLSIRMVINSCCMIIQPQKSSQIPRKILFMKDGRLTLQTPLTELQENIKLMDSTNLATITGIFRQGLCEKAEINSLNPRAIRNISVEIRSEGSVWMGGQAVEELQMGETVFQGGYRGYQRSGYASTQDMEGGRIYDQHCLWNGNRETGTIVKEHQDNENHVSSLITVEYFGDKWVETKVGVINQRYTKTVKDSEGLSQSLSISKQEHQKIVCEGIKFKQQMISTHKQAIFMSSVKERPLQWVRYDQQALHSAQISKLSDDLCEVYLSYLSSQSSNHSKKRTAVLSLNLVDLLYQRSEKKDVAAKIDWVLQPFKKPFHILGGFWERVIIPLVLNTSNRHYSFAVIELHPFHCTYYDSASVNNAKLYERLIKDFLVEEGYRSGMDRPKKGDINFQICLQFPLQKDDKSCGYFMLEGIQEMMSSGKIDFQDGDLPIIKLKILNKLRSLM